LGWWNSQYMESHKSHVPNHQPVMFCMFKSGANSQDQAMAPAAIFSGYLDGCVEHFSRHCRATPISRLSLDQCLQTCLGLES
jgi:hypothetical protein